MKLPFAENQLYKITLSHFSKSFICWESTMQNNTLSLWGICSLLEITDKSFSHIRLNDMRKRESPKAESKMQTHSLFLPKWERESGLEEVWTKCDCDFYYCIMTSIIVHCPESCDQQNAYAPKTLTNQIRTFLHRRLTPPVLWHVIWLWYNH